MTFHEQDAAGISGWLVKHTPTTSGVVAAVSILFSLVMAGVLVTTLITANDAWKPLGPYPIQTVRGTTTFDSPIEGENIVYPAVRLSDDAIRVTGTKCYKEAVSVSGSVSWSSVQPPGLSLFVGEGTGERAEGCMENSYVNQIPPTVHSWAVARFAEGETFVLVKISGREIAERADGENSIPLTWQTEPFAIVPDRES